MKNRYDCVMEHIQVTPEIHDRIMNNLDKNFYTNKQRHVRNYRKIISIAACLVLLLVGTLVIRNIVDIAQPPVTQFIPVEYSSVQELSKGVGFNVREVHTYPFVAEQIQYIAYSNKLAKIVYKGGDNTLVFRMSAGSDDNSGDYNEYSDVRTCALGDYTVTLKGTANQFSLALWEADGYSYSVNISHAVSEKEMLEVLQSIR